MINIAFENDGSLPVDLLCLDDLHVEEVLLLALLALLKLSLGSEQELESVLSLCIDQNAYDRDAQEIDLQGSIELSRLDHLREQEHVIGPGKDAWKDLLYCLGRLVIVGLVWNVREESYRGEYAKQDTLKIAVLFLWEEGEDEYICSFGKQQKQLRPCIYPIWEIKLSKSSYLEVGSLVNLFS